MTQEQKIAYKALVDQVRSHYLTDPPEELCWCPDCQEAINLWTYWQGRDCGRVRILLVGQDWGCTTGPESRIVLDSIRRCNRGLLTPYLMGNGSLTDRNLIALFQSIGYDICYSDPCGGELFFTNLVLGYRKQGTSGNFKMSWLEDSLPYFEPLAQLLTPEYILCLGKATYAGVLTALRLPVPHIPSYNAYLESGKNFTDASPGGQPVRICALAHCGKLGTRNRNHGSNPPVPPDSLELQLRDWRRLWSLPSPRLAF